ncbi:MAG: hypothetical protein KAH38_09900, partial [Candidatus Hydrogenedentes bacterium]|nr:hypothetical protein [Candidatus Hydrogenedentota bacterium]
EASLAQLQKLVSIFTSISQRTGGKVDIIAKFTEILERTDYKPLQNIIRARLHAMEAQTKGRTRPEHPEHPAPHGKQK